MSKIGVDLAEPQDMKLLRDKKQASTILLDTLATPIVTLNKNYAVQYVNPAFEVLFEISARGIEGELLVEFIPAIQALAPSLQAVVEQGESLTELEFGFVIQGRTMLADCRMTPLVNKRGAVSGVVIEWTDLERHLELTKRANAETLQSLSREVIRGLAHEIKNPLGGLRGAAQLLQRKLPVAQQQYTDIIIKEADRLRAIVDRLLGPNRPPKLATINIHQITEHVVALTAAEYADAIQITKDYDPSVPEVLADAELMIQALLNLVRNAVQAMQGHGELILCTRAVRQVEIGTKRHKLALSLQVIDNGPGIPAELQERIFYPMVTGRPDGQGLGLPISQSLVAQHGGAIECNSEPGRTCFTVLLPMELH